ncbi:hypothetical protein NQ318_011802 [Aromia moschata]|uniref:Uncharacterized protein n=1 Tax=Aromia moschata TaxID=1265417 RepID=A0AAV8Y6T5_9CUCU|nr:hypothetical protein NQ318_011802 [Aromia moschata]
MVYEVWLLNNRTDAATSALRACRESLNRTVSGDTFPIPSWLHKPEGRETTEDNPRPGRPSTSKTEGNIKKN